MVGIPLIKQLLLFLCVYYFVSISLETLIKNKVHSTPVHQDITTTTHFNNFDLAISIFSLVLLTVLLILLKDKNWLRWIYLIFMVLSCLRIVSQTMTCASVLHLSLKDTNNPTFSFRERSIVAILGCMVSMLQLYLPLEKWWDYFGMLPVGGIADLCRCAYLVFIYFIDVFFICSLIMSPILHISRLSVYLGKKMTPSYSIYKNKIISMCESDLQKPILVNKLMTSAKNSPVILKVIFYIVAVFSIPFDIIFIIFEFLLRGVCLSIFMYILVSIGNLCSFACTLSERFLMLSDKKITSLAFRLSIIFSLSIVVIINEYHPFFRFPSQSTEILKFASSSIIIPLVFEWIYTFRNQT